MREWIGERTIKQLQAYKYTVRNKDWEATIAVKENDLRDDNLGVYGIQAANAGYAAKQFPDELIFKLVSAGFTNLCYDGKPFYSAEHPVGENAGVQHRHGAPGGGYFRERPENLRRRAHRDDHPERLRRAAAEHHAGHPGRGSPAWRLRPTS